MAETNMVELIIKIPEGLKKDFEFEQWTALSCMEMKNALINGIPLPKGHGDLIEKIYKAISAEEDNLTGAGMTFEEMDAYNDGIDAMYSLVKGARPIIEADKEYENIKRKNDDLER